MHALPALKQAAQEAFDTEDGFGDLTGFFSIVAPQSVLELAEIAENRITGEAVQRLHQIIELSRHARIVVGATTR
jgi:hypothetical protein